MNLRRVVVAAIVATVALPVSLPAFAQEAPLPTSDPAVGTGAGVSWLRSQIGDDGAVRGTTGQIDLGGTRNIAHALALSGDDGAHLDAALDVLAADQTSLTNADGPVPGAIGQLLALVSLQDGDPRDFGGTDLIDLLISSQRTAPDADAGLFGAQAPTYDGAFRQATAIIGLANSGDTSAEVAAAIAAAASWLGDQQCADGSWVAYRADTGVACPAADPATFTGPDSNSTATATVALSLVDHQIIDPTNYFSSNQGADGGWALFAGTDQASDSNSTAWAIRALRALERPDDAEAIAALLAFQLGCDAEPADQGAFMYNAAAPAASPLATIDAVPALALIAAEATATNPCADDASTTTSTTTSTVATTSTTSVPSTTTPTAVAAATAAPATPVPASRVTFAG